MRIFTFRRFIYSALVLSSFSVFADTEWRDDLCGTIGRGEIVCRQISSTSPDGKSRVVLYQMNIERPIVAIFYNAPKINAFGGRVVIQTVDRTHLSSNSAFGKLFNTVKIEMIRNRPELGGTVLIQEERFPLSITTYEGNPTPASSQK